MSKTKTSKAKQILEAQAAAMIESLKHTLTSANPDRLTRHIRGIMPQIQAIKALKEAAEWM